MTTFTRENQKENNITTTTTQSVKHSIYSNVEYTISGHWNTEEDCKIWRHRGTTMSMLHEGLHLDDAIIICNKLISTL
jgi:hypothetical protein